MNYHLPIKAFIATFLMLAIVQVKLENPYIILERFVKGGGWFEIVLIAAYAAFLIHKMEKPGEVAKWRKISWLIFSAVFFSQLVLGIFVESRFLMTGKLHLPVPALILSGSIYRANISFMPILFLSTIVLSGPAWCSQLCYFGAFDNLAANGKKRSNKPIKNKLRIKYIGLIIIIVVTLVLRIVNVSVINSTIIAIVFGLVGILIIIFISGRTNKMVHCITYCPIGTIASYLKYISPFRMKIANSCTNCMACITKCKYDALSIMDIENKKPGITCTYCGDCLSSCTQNSIEYRFFRISSEKARNLYLIITVSLHAIFIGLGRI
ncbi:4Fe-4S binding protein [Bacteroidota bacterium]